MKKHLVFLSCDEEGRMIPKCCVSYINKAPNKYKNDSVIITDWKKFRRVAREIVDKDPDKRYCIGGSYTKTTKVSNKVRIDGGRVSYHTDKHTNEDIGWRKLESIAHSIFGDEYKVTHEPFRDHVFITKK